MIYSPNTYVVVEFYERDSDIQIGDSVINERNFYDKFITLYS